MKVLSIISIFVVIFLFDGLMIQAAPGDLDPTFGPVGFVTTSISTGADKAFAAVRQADGKLVLAGTRNFNAVAVVRYNANGTLDNSFGNGGIVTTQITNIYQATAVAVQPDGKIVVAVTGGGNFGYAVVRYNANGTLDVTFDGDGIYTDTTTGTPNALAIQPDGKIVTAGSITQNFFSNDFSIVRLNPNGTLDTSFDGDGKLVINVGDQNGSNDFAYSLVLQPDGRIVIGGEGDFIGTARDFALVRLNPDGSFDTTFGGSGKIHTAFGGSGQNEAARAIALQSDGRIVAVGYGGENSVRGFAVARYNADGSPDTTFDGDGRVVTPTSNNSNEAANAVVVQTDGKIVVVGYRVSQLALVRYNTDGSLDTTFDGDGSVYTTVFSSGSAIARAALLEPNGKIVIAGDASKGGSTDEDFVLARYNADGTPSTDFGVFGYVVTNPFDQIGQSSQATAVVTQPDGKIVVGGNRVISQSLTVGAILRYTADGRLDSSFASSTSGSGTVTIFLSGTVTQELNSVVIQPDGKIVAVGTYEDQADIGIFVVRINTDGTFDSTFGNGSGNVRIASADGGGLGQDVALQADGKIVVAGAAPNFVTQTTEFAAYRFNSDGSRDNSFGTNGVTRAAVSSGSDIAFSVVIQPDNKIVLGGAADFPEQGFSVVRSNRKISFGKIIAEPLGNADGNTAFVRFNGNGTLDNNFGIGGKVVISVSSFTDLVTDIQLQSDGKITAAATICRDAGCNNIGAALLRYNANGTLDNSFDGDGMAPVEIPNSAAVLLVALSVQTDGKIVAAGTNLSSTAQIDTLVVRRNADGSPDASFGTGGYAISDIGGSEQQSFAVALQTNGKIVTAGYSRNATRDDIAVWRFLGDAVSANRRTKFDFDGDGKADISVFRPNNGAWYLQQSSAGFAGLAFGIASDKLVSADYDGDGKTDVAVYRSGTWYLMRSQLGFTGVAFGDANDIPVPADYDGDGRADLAVFRPSNGTWYLQRSANGFTGIQFGQNGDKPVVADYDGDGKTDIAVNRLGTWYLDRSQLGFYGIQFGDSNDKLVPADYDGDGKTDIAVFRPSNGTWYLLQSTAGFTGITFGLGTDIPVAADYDGDGKADVAVVRGGTWYIQRSSQGFTGVQFGTSTDLPIPNTFVR